MATDYHLSPEPVSGRLLADTLAREKEIGMGIRRTVTLAAASLTLAAAPALAQDRSQDWTHWRGPLGSGASPAADPPLEWSDTKNVKWKAQIPGEGYSTPIVNDGVIYVMTAVDTGRAGAGPSNIFSYRVIALSLESGRELWSTTIKEEPPHGGLHQTNVEISASPIIAGSRLYAFFGSRGVFCLDLKGDVIWDRDLGDMRTRNDFGEGASCAVANGTVLVPWDHEGDSALYALDAGTGETKWKVDRDERTTWTTPVVTRVNGTDQVLMPGTNACIAYDLKSGKELWRTKGLTVNVIPTTIVKDGIAYMTSGYRGSSLVAIDLAKASAGAGNDAILWEHDRATPYVPSPALLGDDIYFLRSNSGVLSSINIDTGKPNYQGQRLDDVRNVYSSIGIAAGHLFICGREGGTAIVKAGDNFELVRINRLDEGINASPVFVGGDLLIRTRSTLYCFSKAGA